MTVGLVAIAAAFAFLDRRPATGGGPSVTGIVTLIAMVVYIASFAFSLGPVVWTLIAEIYPNRIRGKAMAVTTAFNWGAAFIVSATFLSIMNAIGESTTFLIFAALCVITFRWVKAKVPETKGKSLEQIRRPGAEHDQARQEPKKLGQALAYLDESCELMANFAACTGLRWGELVVSPPARSPPPPAPSTSTARSSKSAASSTMRPRRAAKRRRTIYPSRTPEGYALADLVTARFQAARTEQRLGTTPLGLMFPSPRGAYRRARPTSPAASWPTPTRPPGGATPLRLPGRGTPESPPIGGDAASAFRSDNERAPENMPHGLEVQTMAKQAVGTTTSAGAKAGTWTIRIDQNLARKAVAALVTVLIIQTLFALCLVSAQQLLAPRNMPFGVVGPSKVVAAVNSKITLATIGYPNKSAAMTAINRGELYGAYVTGSSSDTLIVVPAKSFFARLALEPAFVSAAHKLGRPVTVQTVKPLPPYDRIGAVVSLLLLPLLIGGYLAAVLVFKAAGRTAAAPWRVVILTAYAVVGAVLTDLIAGPRLGAYSTSHFWPLLPCFALITTAVVLAAAAIQGLAGARGTLLVLVLFIVIGGSGAGGLGTYMLPVYWRNIGVLLPPQSAVDLMRNVIYFGGNDITTPLIVLFAYALAGAVVITYLIWNRRARTARAAAAHAREEAAHAREDMAAAQSPGNPPPGPAGQKRRGRPILIALVICAFMECLFAFNYMSAGHQPVATNMPFGVTGPSPILTAAEKTFSLKVTHYPNEQAVKTAIGQAEIWGALIPASTAGKPSTLIVVPSISDLSPLDIAVQFEHAAKTAGQKLTIQQYAPVPLPAKDPFGLVPSLMMLALLIGGYIAATMLMNATGRAGSRWRAAVLAAFAIVAGLVVDLVVCFWLGGYASGKFWIVWPISSLIIAVTAFVAATLQKLIGPRGTLLTIIVILLFGNPSSGGANGALYLPTFWRDIGPFLPPRNAYILLHQTIYFHGNGTTQSLIVLLAYFVVAGALVILLDRLRPQAEVNTEAAETAAMTVPVGATP